MFSQSSAARQDVRGVGETASGTTCKREQTPARYRMMD
jgi:hypothetical protein